MSGFAGGGCLINLDGGAAQPPRALSAPGEAAPATALHIDYREDGLKSALSIPYSSQTLHVGDIWIGVGECGKPALILERKSVSDWESSLMDGRYREQRGRLLAFSQETGARVGYVLEGRWDGTRRLNGGAKALMKLVSRMQFVHGIPVIHTLNVKETAALVESLQDYWEKEGSTIFQAETSAQRAADGIKVVKKDNLEDPRLFAIRCVSQVPGVSTAVAEAILSGCGGTLQGVMKTDADVIANIRVGDGPKGRRVGPAVAGRVVRLFSAEPAADN